MSLGLLITTCKHYYTNIPKLIENITSCGFPKENVLIVSGEENENSTCSEDGIQIVKVTYTGLHLTGAIFLSENIDLIPSIKYWALLPDTIKLNESFYANIMKYYDLYLKDSEIYSMPFLSPNVRLTTMDMGIVSIGHILNMTDYLSKIKLVQPYSRTETTKLKKQLIYNENIILGMQSPCPVEATKFKHLFPLYIKPSIFITNNKSELRERRIMIGNRLCNEVYFLNIDLYKYQRNFIGPDAIIVMDL